MTNDLTATTEYSFPGFGKTEGACLITLGYSSGKRPIIVCSQKHNYFGTSITNAAEVIANDFIIDLMAASIPDGRFDPSDTSIQAKLRNDLAKHWTKSIRNNCLVLGRLFRESGLRWLEHYPAGTGIVSSDRFTEVVFSDSNNPEWLQSMSAETARIRFGDALIDRALTAGRGQ